MIIISLVVSRMFLFVGSFKIKSLCYAFFYFEAIFQIIGHFLPVRLSEDYKAEMYVEMLLTLQNFLMFYKYFASSLLISCLSLISLRLGELFALGMPENSAYFIFSTCVMIIWALFTLTMVHVLVIK